MLQIKNLSIYLREDLRSIIEDFSFAVAQGDKVALIGEEGNGKSILLKTIYRRSLTEACCDIKGDIYKAAEIVGYLPQIIEEKYMDLSTEEYLMLMTGGQKDYTLYYQLLSDFSLDEELISNDVKISFLSGGEKIKFILFVEMLKSPTLLLMDEPSNDLDMDSLIWLEAFMKRLEIPLIFVSHDTKLLSNVANKIIHLEVVDRRRKVRHTISSDGYDEYVRKRLKHIDVERRRAKKEKEEFAEKMSRYRRVHDSVENALRATKNDSEGKNLKDKMHTVKSVGRRIEREKKNMSKNPEIEDAINIFFDDRLYIPNGRVILDFKLDELKAGNRLLSKNIELKITGPEKICIVGKNGSGKTTLIKRLINEFESLKFKVGYMPQNYSDLTNYDVNAIEYLSRSFSKDEHSTVSTYLAALNFKREEMYRKIQNLSGGQKAKLFFAKMNLDCAEVLVLDEPTRNLSPLSQPEILNALADYRGVIIAISHDRDFIGQIPEKVYELNEEGLFRIN